MYTCTTGNFNNISPVVDYLANLHHSIKQLKIKNIKTLKEHFKDKKTESENPFGDICSLLQNVLTNFSGNRSTS